MNFDFSTIKAPIFSDPLKKQHKLYIPACISVGKNGKNGKNEENIAAISGRWMLSTWTCSSSFCRWCGFMPSTSRSSEKELKKAVYGNCFSVKNEWLNGFKLNFSFSSRKRPIIGTYLDRNGIAQKNIFKQKVLDFSTVVVEDPRGWSVQITQDNLYGILEAEECGIQPDGQISCQICYALTDEGYMLLTKKLASALNAMTEEDAIAAKAKFSARRKTKVTIEEGRTYSVQADGKNVSFLCIGKLPPAAYFLPDDLFSFNGVLQIWRIVPSLLNLNKYKSYSSSTIKECYNLLPWNNSNYKYAVQELKEYFSKDDKLTFLKLECTTNRNIDSDLSAIQHQHAAELLSWPEWGTYKNLCIDGKFRNFFIEKEIYEHGWFKNGIAVLQFPDKKLELLDLSKNQSQACVKVESHYQSFKGSIKLSDEVVASAKQACKDKAASLKAVLDAMLEDFPTECPLEGEKFWIDSIVKKSNEKMSFNSTVSMYSNKYYSPKSSYDWNVFGN